MTAHIIYDKIDQNFTASHSDILIKNIIRKKLKYKGLIMSDGNESIKRKFVVQCY